MTDARSDDDEDRRRQRAERETSERRLPPDRNLELRRVRFDRIERPEKPARRQRNEERHQRVQRQMGRYEWITCCVREQSRLAEERDEDRVRDDARQDRRDERVGFEIVAMQDLDGEKRGAERRAKDGGHTGGGPGDQKDPPFTLSDPQPLRDQRAERAADLHGRPLAPAAAAESQCKKWTKLLLPRQRACARSRPDGERHE